MTINDAEPVGPKTVRRFTTRFAHFGFRANAMTPVHGLAKFSVGLSFPPIGREPVIDRAQRTALTRKGAATPASADEAAALEFVACRHALSDHEIRIVDLSGRELEDRREGRVQFRGTPEYASAWHRQDCFRT